MKFPWQRRGYLYPLAFLCRKLDRFRMEHVAAKLVFLSSIELIPYDRMAYGIHMHPYLMCAPSKRFKLHQCVFSYWFDRFIECNGLAYHLCLWHSYMNSSFHRTVFQTYRLIDFSPAGQAPMHERKISFLYSLRLERSEERRVGKESRSRR